jgi:hypothetical protein
MHVPVEGVRQVLYVVSLHTFNFFTEGCWVHENEKDSAKVKKVG